VRTNLPIKQVLHKVDLVGRMMRWAIELSEYGLLFEGRGLVRPQVLVDFVAELTVPSDEEMIGGAGGGFYQWMEHLISKAVEQA